MKGDLTHLRRASVAVLGLLADALGEDLGIGTGVVAEAGQHRCAKSPLRRATRTSKKGLGCCAFRLGASCAGGCPQARAAGSTR